MPVIHETTISENLRLFFETEKSGNFSNAQETVLKFLFGEDIDCTKIKYVDDQGNFPCKNSCNKSKTEYPDLVFWGPDLLYFLEIKIGNSRLTSAQKNNDTLNKDHITYKQMLVDYKNNNSHTVTKLVYLIPVQYSYDKGDIDENDIRYWEKLLDLINKSNICNSYLNSIIYQVTLKGCLLQGDWLLSKEEVKCFNNYNDSLNNFLRSHDYLLMDNFYVHEDLFEEKWENITFCIEIYPEYYIKKYRVSFLILLEKIGNLYELDEFEYQIGNESGLFYVFIPLLQPEDVIDRIEKKLKDLKIINDDVVIPKVNPCDLVHARAKRSFLQKIKYCINQLDKIMPGNLYEDFKHDEKFHCSWWDVQIEGLDMKFAIGMPDANKKKATCFFCIFKDDQWKSATFYDSEGQKCRSSVSEKIQGRINDNKTYPDGKYKQLVDNFLNATVEEDQNSALQEIYKQLFEDAEKVEEFGCKDIKNKCSS